MIALLGINTADAQSYKGILVLDPISPKIKTGDPIVFSGQLYTDSRQPVSKAVIYIMDDVFWGRDKVITQTTTDSDGKFYATWTAKQRSSGAYDIYAVFDGSTNVKKARSDEYKVQVSSSSSSSQKHPTTIKLDRIPSSIYAEDTVTFTGRLTSNGSPLENALIKIKEDDPALPDETLGYGRTNSNGEFSITKSIGAAIHEKDFDVYAIFDGFKSYSKDRSSNQLMKVVKHGGAIKLDPLQNSAKVGEIITFSGTLYFDNHSTKGAIVYIKDADRLNPDDLLATGYVGQNGKFSANWFADHVDPDNTVDIYAVFEGNDEISRLTTCDKNPTSWLGGLCSNTIDLRISGTVRADPPSNYIPKENAYMELNYALNFIDSPHVAIIPSPDSYNKVKKHIVPVMEGIRMLEYDIEQKYGGNWDISFEVVNKEQIFFKSQPDVIVNLVTSGESNPVRSIDRSVCSTDYYGVAYSVAPSVKKPVQTIVCSTVKGEQRSNVGIAATAAHEFIHAIGLGHTFNKAGDLMCSKENDRWTCPPGIKSKSKNLSNLNLDAVVKIYGRDGFKNPNNYVTYKEKFVLGTSINNNHPVTPKITVPSQTPTLLSTWNDKQRAFTVDYPKGWLVDTSGEYGDLVSFYDKKNWESYISIYHQGDPLDDNILNSLEQTERDYCRNATLNYEGFTCSNFMLIGSNIDHNESNSVYMAAMSYYVTRQYNDADPIKMVILVYEISDGSSAYQFYSESHKEYAEKYGRSLIASMQSFKITR